VTLSPRYEVRIKAPAEREMDRLDPPIFSRITQAILSLETNPRPLNSKKLHDEGKVPGTNGANLRTPAALGIVQARSRAFAPAPVALGFRPGLLGRGGNRTAVFVSFSVQPASAGLRVSSQGLKPTADSSKPGEPGCTENRQENMLSFSPAYKAGSEWRPWRHKGR